MFGAVLQTRAVSKWLGKHWVFFGGLFFLVCGCYWLIGAPDYLISDHPELSSLDRLVLLLYGLAGLLFISVVSFLVWYWDLKEHKEDDAKSRKREGQA